MDLLTQEDQLPVTLFNKCREFSDHMDALFKLSVESGCMARKVVSLRGSAFGLTTIYVGSGFRLAQPAIVIRTQARQLSEVILIGLGNSISNSLLDSTVGFFDRPQFILYLSGRLGVLPSLLVPLLLNDLHTAGLGCEIGSTPRPEEHAQNQESQNKPGDLQHVSWHFAPRIVR